jgi:hypothetical protein
MISKTAASPDSVGISSNSGTASAPHASPPVTNSALSSAASLSAHRSPVPQSAAPPHTHRYHRPSRNALTGNASASAPRFRLTRPSSALGDVQPLSFSTASPQKEIKSRPEAVPSPPITLPKPSMSFASPPTDSTCSGSVDSILIGLRLAARSGRARTVRQLLQLLHTSGSAAQPVALDKNLRHASPLAAAVRALCTCPERPEPVIELLVASPPASLSANYTSPELWLPPPPLLPSSTLAPLRPASDVPSELSTSLFSSPAPGLPPASSASVLDAMSPKPANRLIYPSPSPPQSDGAVPTSPSAHLPQSHPSSSPSLSPSLSPAYRSSPPASHPPTSVARRSAAAPQRLELLDCIQCLLWAGATLQASPSVLRLGFTLTRGLVRALLHARQWHALRFIVQTSHAVRLHASTSASSSSPAAVSEGAECRCASECECDCECVPNSTEWIAVLAAAHDSDHAPSLPTPSSASSAVSSAAVPSAAPSSACSRLLSCLQDSSSTAGFTALTIALRYNCAWPVLRALLHYILLTFTASQQTETVSRAAQRALALAFCLDARSLPPTQPSQAAVMRPCAKCQPRAQTANDAAAWPRTTALCSALSNSPSTASSSSPPLIPFALPNPHEWVVRLTAAGAAAAQSALLTALSSAIAPNRLHVVDGRVRLPLSVPLGVEGKALSGRSLREAQDVTSVLQALSPVQGLWRSRISGRSAESTSTAASPTMNALELCCAGSSNDKVAAARLQCALTLIEHGATLPARLLHDIYFFGARCGLWNVLCSAWARGLSVHTVYVPPPSASAAGSQLPLQLCWPAAEPSASFDVSGQTALIVAVRCAARAPYEVVVQRLMECGAEVNALDANGRSAGSLMASAVDESRLHSPSLICGLSV